jgi:hypothetical protein
LGIIPIISLWDLSHPIWFENYGGFYNKKNIKFFLIFVNKILNLLPNNGTIITFNNPQQIEVVKSVINNKQSKNSIKLYRNIVRANGQATRLIKDSGNTNRVGLALPISMFNYLNNKDNSLNNKLTRVILLNEIKKSCDFFALIINNQGYIEPQKNLKLIAQLNDVNNEEEVYGDLDEGSNENQLVGAINYFDKKLQMPILIINRSVSDLEQKYYSKELEVTTNSIFKTVMQGASIIGLVYSSLSNSQPFSEGIFTSRSLSLEDIKNGKTLIHPRARAINSLISQVNKVRRPNYQPVVSAIIDSMNKYKQSKKNKVKLFFGESTKKLSLKVDRVKYKNRLSPSDKMLNDSKSVLKLSMAGEGVNPFDVAKNLSVDGINRVKLKSSQVRDRVISKVNSVTSKNSVTRKATRPIGDFIKKPGTKFKKPSSGSKTQSTRKTKKSGKKVV